MWCVLVCLLLLWDVLCCCMLCCCNVCCIVCHQLRSCNNTITQPAYFTYIYTLSVGSAGSHTKAIQHSNTTIQSATQNTITQNNNTIQQHTCFLRILSTGKLYQCTHSSIGWNPLSCASASKKERAALVTPPILQQNSYSPTHIQHIVCNPHHYNTQATHQLNSTQLNNTTPPTTHNNSTYICLFGSSCSSTKYELNPRMYT